MRALVTGGAGFIGGHVVDLLLAKGYQVRILDNLELPTHAAGVPDYVPPQAEFLHGDVGDPDTLARALDGVDVVLHQAATGGFTPEIRRYLANNSVGTAAMLEVIRDRRLPIRKIVVASSIAVYGEGSYYCPQHRTVYPPPRPVAQLQARDWELHCPHCPHRGAAVDPLPIHEDKPVAPATAYSISKYDQERLVLMFGQQTGIPTVALRYFVTYGPRQSVHNPYTGVCNIFSTRILNGLLPVIYEDGRQTRDFVFVEDVARANLFVLEEPRAHGTVYNVGTGVGTSILQLAHTLRKCLGRPGEVELPGRFRPGESRHVVADPGRLAALGFRAVTPLEEGLARYVAWLRTRGPLPELFTEAERRLQDSGVVRSS